MQKLMNGLIYRGLDKQGTINETVEHGWSHSNNHLLSARNGVHVNATEGFWAFKSNVALKDHWR